MNTFETLSEKKVSPKEERKGLIGHVIESAREKIKEEIINMAKNSEDPMIKSHLMEFVKDESRLEKLSDDDLIAFNEVIVKGKWKEWNKKPEEGNPSKLEEYRKKVSEYAASQGVAEENFDACEDPRCTFSSMIYHHVIDCETIEEREELINNAKRKFDRLSKAKPHIAAYIEGINWASLWNSDFRVVDNLNEPEILNHEKKLKSYFSEKFKDIQGENLIDKKRLIIENDPRFKCYCAAKEALELGPCHPDIFM